MKNDTEDPMEKLYLQTQSGRIPLDPEVVRKYGLRAGMTSAGSLIVNERGEAPNEKDVHRPASEQYINEQPVIHDEIAQLDNGMTLQTSEMIDFAQATDSVDRT
jgi:hypothetical protein